METGSEWYFPSLKARNEAPSPTLRIHSGRLASRETVAWRSTGGARGDEVAVRGDGVAARIPDGDPPRHLLTGKRCHLFLPHSCPRVLDLEAAGSNFRALLLDS